MFAEVNIIFFKNGSKHKLLVLNRTVSLRNKTKKKKKKKKKQKKKKKKKKKIKKIKNNKKT